MALNFTSNDVLGLASNKRINAPLNKRLIATVWDQPILTIIWQSSVFLETEAFIADWIGKPSAVLFNSGFQIIRDYLRL